MMSGGKIYLTNEYGEPSLTEKFIQGLNEDDKIKVALVLKNDGDEFYVYDQYEKAIKFYTAALQLKEDPDLYSGRSACYDALFYPDKVIEDTTAALKLDPTNIRCLLRRSKIYEDLGMLEKCIQDLYAFMSLSPGADMDAALRRPMTKHCLNVIQKEKYKDEELPNASAIHSILKGLEVESIELNRYELDSSSGDHHLLNGLTYFNERTNESYIKAEHEFIKAVESFGKEIKNNNTNELKQKLAMSLEYTSIYKLFKNDLMNAESDIQTAIELYPRAKTYIIASMASPNPDLNHSIEMLNKAIELDHRSAEAYIFKGNAYLKLGHNYITSAKESYEKAISSNPENPHSYIQLGRALSVEGSFTKAKEIFQIAVGKFPQSPDVTYEYGEVFIENGFVSEAIKRWDLA